MSSLLRVLAAAAFLVGTAGTASAELLRWEGTLTLEIPGAALDPSPVPYGLSPVATVNGSAGLGHLTTLSISEGYMGTGSMFVTDPYLAPIVAVRVRSLTLGSGVLRPISGATASGEGLTQNVLPLGGELRFCILFASCTSYLPVPLTVGGTRGMGIGGMLTVNGYGPGIQVSMYGAPWTIGLVTVTGLPTGNGGFSIASASGFVHGPASNTSSTARIGGEVQLVTSAAIVSTLGGSAGWPVLGTLNIHFVPEPEAVLLFAAGLTSLGIARRWRAKK